MFSCVSQVSVMQLQCVSHSVTYKMPFQSFPDFHILKLPLFPNPSSKLSLLKTMCSLLSYASLLCIIHNNFSYHFLFIVDHYLISSLQRSIQESTQ